MLFTGLKCLRKQSKRCVSFRERQKKTKTQVHLGLVVEKPAYSVLLLAR